ncbi:MAG: hypothetical protein ABI091_23840 [Ferruginibacter sp.]
MAKRKKWTAKEDITDSLLKFREKRKWQLSLRRYVLEKNHCQFYAPYFGLPIEDFRKWIEIQFTNDLSWDNFAESWQFDHIVPVAYFDFALEEDLRLCWNFINIRVESINDNKNRGQRIDVLAVKPYFEALLSKTGLTICSKMLAKINALQVSSINSEPTLEAFLINKKDNIETLTTLNSDDFKSINEGVTIKDILLEKEILKKFG